MKKAACILLTAVFALSAWAATDPFVGKWVLDVKRSQYPPGTCPISMTIEMEPAGKGIHYRSDTVQANGRAAHSEYTADYDGNQAIVTGRAGVLLPVFLKRIDSRTVLASYTKHLMVVATSERVVSEDKRR